jgi:hypothetical protein
MWVAGLRRPLSVPDPDLWSLMLYRGEAEGFGPPVQCLHDGVEGLARGPVAPPWGGDVLCQGE